MSIRTSLRGDILFRCVIVCKCFLNVTCENRIPAILPLIPFDLECVAAVLVDNATQYKYVLGGLPSDLDSGDTLNAINGAQC